MAKNDYTAFDAELLASIAGGNNTFNGLQFAMEQHAKAFCDDKTTEPFRVVDRRLQALRKAKKLHFNRIKRSWEITTKGVA